jgi:hypothetical protein
VLFFGLMSTELAKKKKKLPIKKLEDALSTIANDGTNRRKRVALDALQTMESQLVQAPAPVRARIRDELESAMSDKQTWPIRLLAAGTVGRVMQVMRNTKRFNAAEWSPLCTCALLCAAQVRFSSSKLVWPALEDLVDGGVEGAFAVFLRRVAWVVALPPHASGRLKPGEHADVFEHLERTVMRDVTTMAPFMNELTEVLVLARLSGNNDVAAVERAFVALSPLWRLTGTKVQLANDLFDRLLSEVGTALVRCSNRTSGIAQQSADESFYAAASAFLMVLRSVGGAVFVSDLLPHSQAPVRFISHCLGAAKMLPHAVGNLIRECMALGVAPMLPSALVLQLCVVATSAIHGDHRHVGNTDRAGRYSLELAWLDNVLECLACHQPSPEIVDALDVPAMLELRLSSNPDVITRLLKLHAAFFTDAHAGAASVRTLARDVRLAHALASTPLSDDPLPAVRNVDVRRGHYRYLKTRGDARREIVFALRALAQVPASLLAFTSKSATTASAAVAATAVDAAAAATTAAVATLSLSSDDTGATTAADDEDDRLFIARMSAGDNVNGEGDDDELDDDAPMDMVVEKSIDPEDDNDNNDNDNDDDDDNDDNDGGGDDDNDDNDDDDDDGDDNDRAVANDDADIIADNHNDNHNDNRNDNNDVKQNAPASESNEKRSFLLRPLQVSTSDAPVFTPFTHLATLTAESVRAPDFTTEAECRQRVSLTLRSVLAQLHTRLHPSADAVAASSDAVCLAAARLAEHLMTLSVLPGEADARVTPHATANCAAQLIGALLRGSASLRGYALDWFARTLRSEPLRDALLADAERVTQLVDALIECSSSRAASARRLAGVLMHEIAVADKLTRDVAARVVQCATMRTGDVDIEVREPFFGVLAVLAMTLADSAQPTVAQRASRVAMWRRLLMTVVVDSTSSGVSTADQLAAVFAPLAAVATRAQRPFDVDWERVLARCGTLGGVARLVANVQQATTLSDDGGTGVQQEFVDALGMDEPEAVGAHQRPLDVPSTPTRRAPTTTTTTAAGASSTASTTASTAAVATSGSPVAAGARAPAVLYGHVPGALSSREVASVRVAGGPAARPQDWLPLGDAVLCDERLARFGAVCAVARAAVSAQLRTPFGDAQQTLIGLERTVRAIVPLLCGYAPESAETWPFAARSGGAALSESLNDASFVARAADSTDATLASIVLELCEQLEKQIYYSAHGAATVCLAPPSAADAFFAANIKTCTDWYARVRPQFMAMALALGARDEVARHGEQRIADLRAQVGGESNVDIAQRLARADATMVVRWATQFGVALLQTASAFVERGEPGRDRGLRGARRAAGGGVFGTQCVARTADRRAARLARRGRGRHRARGTTVQRHFGARGLAARRVEQILQRSIAVLPGSARRLAFAGGAAQRRRRSGCVAARRFRARDGVVFERCYARGTLAHGLCAAERARVCRRVAAADAGALRRDASPLGQRADCARSAAHARRRGDGASDLAARCALCAATVAGGAQRPLVARRGAARDGAERCGRRREAAATARSGAARLGAIAAERLRVAVDDQVRLVGAGCVRRGALGRQSAARRASAGDASVWQGRDGRARLGERAPPARQRPSTRCH